jgi:nucleotide-binding universal stress UspA family protein
MKSQINSLLIPTDFSALSENALKIGISIAKRQGSEITLLHVVDRFSYIQPAEVFLPDFKVTTDIISRMESRLKEFTEQIQHDTGIKIGWKIKSGLPSDEICKIAYEENISLIVMGTHGTSGLREFFIGSEAFRVVKNATCPVLTIPGDWQKTEFKRVVFPIRMLPGAVEKYFYARPIIEKNDSELMLIGFSDIKKSDDAKEIEALIEKLKAQLINDNIKFHSALCPHENFPAETIKIAKDYNADLIILTTNLDYDLKAYFVGPFAQQVVNHSRLPVLSIKPKHISNDMESIEKRAERWGKSINFNDLDTQDDH